MSDSESDTGRVPRDNPLFSGDGASAPQNPARSADHDFDYDTDDESDYCLTCDNEGYIVDCCDDICHGQGYCIHGDNITCPDCHGLNSW